ncbi:TetR/AcrR family transcriptional regulator [Microbacterium sp. ARD32]|uniref:TetR/AcrR family transcriptional regulator n=1 Tax=Microbacterium sp. ARD32 TaxID=2962577 RepID=UPI0028826011|nr:TetR/AcrR family transcriptional regulator [Microbacterium sp. ARD32]MDT0157686.1 TetR/AcrR family transcriptional regulator [Microbacterium sp. ARD32]
MRSASDDLTARARIRESAIRAFARDGFDAASMRTIAADAGVSPALIVHHFGDKRALREACDDHVVSVFTDDGNDLIQGPTADRIRTALHDLDRHGPYIDYLGRMLGDSSPSADRLFDEIVRGTRASLDDQRAAGVLHEMSDPEMTSLLVALIGLAPVVMRAQVARVLGQDQLSPAGMLRTTLPMLELLTHGIYADTRFLEGARQAMAADAPGTEPPVEPRTEEGTQ